MTTPKQAEANVRNSINSTGPVTDAGKRASSINAITHGLTSRRVDMHSPMFASKFDEWAQLYPPQGIEEEMSIQTIVMATIHIDGIDKDMLGLRESIADHAELGWEVARSEEVALLTTRLEKKPFLVSTRLKSTIQGCDYLLKTWKSLAQTFADKNEWLHADFTLALDLLGVDPRTRDGTTVLDNPPEIEFKGFLEAVIKTEIDSIQRTRDEVCVPLDALQRREAMSGLMLYTTKPAKLLLRYRRDAMRLFSEALMFIKARTEARAAVAISKPLVQPDPEVTAPVQPEPAPAPEPAPEPTVRKMSEAAKKEARVVAMAQYLLRSSEDTQSTKLDFSLGATMLSK